MSSVSVTSPGEVTFKRTPSGRPPHRSVRSILSRCRAWFCGFADGSALFRWSEPAVQRAQQRPPSVEPYILLFPLLQVLTELLTRFGHLLTASSEGETPGRPFALYQHSSRDIAAMSRRIALRPIAWEELRSRWLSLRHRTFFYTALSMLCSPPMLLRRLLDRLE